MIYLDNAATSFPKPKCVIRELKKCVERYCGNPGRGSHAMSLKISEKIYEAREEIAAFLGIDAPERVVFTQNATHALNIAIKTTVPANSHVIISDIEHNSVLRPIYAESKKSGIEYSVFASSGDITANIESCIRSNTSCIVSTLASNVTGRCIPLPILSKVAKKHNLKLIVDASQSIGHEKINIKENYCDVLCAPGHKALFGIQGIGFCVFSDDLKRDTVFEGGSGNDSTNLNMPELLPERFEAGTLPSPAIVSLLYGVRYINAEGMECITERVNKLTEYTADAISSIPNIYVYEYGHGIVSFNVKNIPSEFISLRLNKHGICTRGGLHCAPLAHKTFGTVNGGAVRASLSYLNKKSDINEIQKVLRYIVGIYS